MTIIVQLRGTSGAGKSTAMRAVMAALGDWEPAYRAGRRRPLFYRRRPAGDVLVLGHYEVDCGGGDTVGSARQLYELTQELIYQENPRAVLSEGLIASEDVKWAGRWGAALRVAFLVTPLGECLHRVAARRAARGNDNPLDPSNTARRVGVIERSRIKLLAAGATVRRCTAAQAPGVVLRWLGEQGVSYAGRTGLADERVEGRGGPHGPALPLLHAGGAEGRPGAD